MQLLEQTTYRQPSGTVVILRKLRNAYGYKYVVERMLGNCENVQEGWYGWWPSVNRKRMREWARFEHKIGSVKINSIVLTTKSKRD